MSTQLTGSDLLQHGWDQGPAIGSAIRAVTQLQQNSAEINIWAELDAVKNNPIHFLDDELWAETARHLAKQDGVQGPALREEPAPLTVWGRNLIDAESFEQINNAARLPVTVRVALMPDAHVGYGLPIGGVAALEGAIAPYMVGVDIGCRMHVTVFDRSPTHLKQKPKRYEQLLLDYTYFGRTTPRVQDRAQHPILDDPRWEQLPRHLRQLKETAAKQLGTSGGGNHFAEWCNLTVTGVNDLGIEQGNYIALATHSGSRGVGFKIAQHYSQLAEKICSFLPKDIRKLAYLDYKIGDAQEYEIAMNLAGDFARACHEVIHERIADALGGTVAGVVQNHHNFAWRVEQENGTPIFIHRKGATPAGQGVNGVIPGSMATTGFLVEGRGDSAENILDNPSLNSASHGSGRTMGRKQAAKRLDRRKVREFLKARGVTLLGAGLDEAPNAYKNPHDVIAAQKDLVRVWGEFMPAIVRMASDGGRTLGERTNDDLWDRRNKKKKDKRKRR